MKSRNKRIKKSKKFRKFNSSKNFPKSQTSSKSKAFEKSKPKKSEQYNINSKIEQILKTYTNPENLYKSQKFNIFNKCKGGIVLHPRTTKKC